MGQQLADCGFFINLDESINRLHLVNEQIDKFNITNLNRFSALRDDLRQYSCTKSHRAIFEYSLSNNFDYVFIAEDDFVLDSKIKVGDCDNISLHSYLSQIKEYIKNYDIIMFGCNPKKLLIPDNIYFAYNTSSTGAWSYIINNKAMRYILDNYEYYKDYMAIDDILPSLNYKGFKTVVTLPQIINHRDGIPSTLQPHVGDTHYSSWINGSWDKHLYNHIQPTKYIDFINQIQEKFIIEKNLTILITGHSVDNWLFFLRYLLKSLPKEFNNCRFIICYDSFSNDDKFEISRYFRDKKSSIYPSVEYVNGGLISSLKKGLENIQTEYFLWLEHDWVFLDNDTINWTKLINVFNKYNFINAIWFNKDDNISRGFETHNYNNSTTPFIREERISELNLTTTCRWSNNPGIFRTSKMKFWFNNYVNNEHVDIVNQGSYNIEESLINIYRNQIDEYGWDKIKDKWGTFLYGDVGDGPFVGHTDASKRYVGDNISQPEINGINYMLKYPLGDDD